MTPIRSLGNTSNWMQSAAGGCREGLRDLDGVPECIGTELPTDHHAIREGSAVLWEACRTSPLGQGSWRWLVSKSPISSGHLVVGEQCIVIPFVTPSECQVHILKYQLRLVCTTNPVCGLPLRTQLSSLRVERQHVHFVS